MMGFKAFHSAQATIAGIETAHMIRKGQLSEENALSVKQDFYAKIMVLSQELLEVKNALSSGITILLKL
jgi:hypothetical protein